MWFVLGMIVGAVLAVVVMVYVLPKVIGDKRGH